MSVFSKYNKGSVYQFKLPELKDGESYLFIKGEDGHRYNVMSFYINTKSDFGDHPVAIVKNNGDPDFGGMEYGFLDLPSHMLPTIKEMERDEEAVAAINAGRLFLRGREYVSDKYHKTCVAFDFYDIDDIEDLLNG